MQITWSHPSHASSESAKTCWKVKDWKASSHCSSAWCDLRSCPQSLPSRKKRLACIDIIEWDISLLPVLLVGCVDNLLGLSEVCSTSQLKFCQLQKANKQLLVDSRPRPKGSKRYGNMVRYYSYPLATVSSSLPDGHPMSSQVASSWGHFKAMVAMVGPPT